MSSATMPPARGGKKRPLKESSTNTVTGPGRPESAVSMSGDSVLSTASSSSATKRRRTDSLYSAHEQSAANYHGVIKPTPKPERDREPCYYGTYLQLDKITGAQKMRSACPDKPLGAHEEHLFIVIHQVYELWFKQILHEIDSVRRIFLTHEVVGAEMGVIVSRLARVKEIQRVLIDQLGVLETMTPQDFLEFRDHLFPASGFQSVQFRLIENKLGLPKRKRMKYSSKSYCTYLSGDDSDVVRKAEEEPSLFDLVNTWLERTPFLKTESRAEDAADAAVIGVAVQPRVHLGMNADRASGNGSSSSSSSSSSFSESLFTKMAR